MSVPIFFPPQFPLTLSCSSCHTNCGTLHTCFFNDGFDGTGLTFAVHLVPCHLNPHRSPGAKFKVFDGSFATVHSTTHFTSIIPPLYPTSPSLHKNCSVNDPPKEGVS